MVYPPATEFTYCESIRGGDQRYHELQLSTVSYEYLPIKSAFGQQAVDVKEVPAHQRVTPAGRFCFRILEPQPI